MNFILFYFLMLYIQLKFLTAPENHSKINKAKSWHKFSTYSCIFCLHYLFRLMTLSLFQLQNYVLPLLLKEFVIFRCVYFHDIKESI